MNNDLTSKYQSFIEHSIIRRENMAREMARFSPNADLLVSAIESAIECRETALRNAKEILNNILK